MSGFTSFRDFSLTNHIFGEISKLFSRKYVEISISLVFNPLPYYILHLPSSFRHQPSRIYTYKTTQNTIEYSYLCTQKR